MKLKWFDARDYKTKRQIKKEKIISEAFRQACIELVIEGNFDTYQKARAEMIKRAKNKLLP